PPPAPSRGGGEPARATCSSGASPAPPARSPWSEPANPAPPHAPPQPRRRRRTGGATRPPWTPRPSRGSEAATSSVSVASGGDAWRGQRTALGKAPRRRKKKTRRRTGGRIAAAAGGGDKLVVGGVRSGGERRATNLRETKRRQPVKLLHERMDGPVILLLQLLLSPSPSPCNESRSIHGDRLKT
uniref:Uncharacterized protein n=1 Tax=Oryza brachyantha TaxID=4533 RepID=J3KW99_ORYBR